MWPSGYRQTINSDVCNQYVMTICLIQPNNILALILKSTRIKKINDLILQLHKFKWSHYIRPI